MGKVPKTGKKVKKTLQKQAKEVEPKVEQKVSSVSVGSGAVSMDQVRKAISELVKYAKKQNDPKQMVFEDSSQSMTVQFNVSRVPKWKFAPNSITLPHPVWTDSSEVCLIVKAPQRKYKDMLTETPIPAVKKVIDVGKWKQRYERYKDRREIASAFELFLIDNRCYEMVGAICGKSFSHGNKTPIPVNIAGDVHKGVQAALSATTYKLAGTCISVRFGRVNFEEDQLVENCEEVIKKVVEYFQSKDISVQKIAVQATDSPTLPVFSCPAPKKLLPPKSQDERAMLKKQAQKKKEAARVAKRIERVPKKAESDDEAEPVKAAELKKVTVVEPKVAKVSKKKGKKSAGPVKKKTKA